MKVNFNDCRKLVRISELRVGATFLVNKKTEIGTDLYMKVDSNEGFLAFPKMGNLAINFETGQIKQFNCDYKVLPTSAEVTIIKG